MKWIACIFFGLCLQSVVSHSEKRFPRMEFNSFYFYKGVSDKFFGAKIDRLRELQEDHPGLKLEFVLVELESESAMTSKRYVSIRKQFQKGGLEMKRISFNPNPILLKNLDNRVPPEPPTTLDSIGAILEGKVLSLD